MSIKNIKNKLQVLESDPSCWAWIESEVVDLITAMAEHLLENKPPNKDASNAQIPEGWIRISSFIRQEKVFAAGTVYTLVSANKDFREKHVLRLGKIIYVDPEALRKTLMNSVRIQKTLARLKTY
jgi:hypothetical protein